MKKRDHKPLGLFLSSLLLIFVSVSDTCAETKVSRPNIVILFIDDMGYGDIGPFGNQVNQKIGRAHV